MPVVYVEVQSIEARNTRGLHGNYRDVVHATLEQLAGCTLCVRNATRGVIDRVRQFTEAQQYV